MTFQTTSANYGRPGEDSPMDPREKYRRPELKCFGTLVELTQGGTHGEDDGDLGASLTGGL